MGETLTNPETVHPEPIPDSPVDSSAKPQANSSFWTVLIIILVLLIVGVGAFITYQLGRQTKNLPPASPAVAPGPKPSADVTAPQSGPKRIVYNKDNTLYVINADGSNKTKIASEEDIRKKSWSGSAAGIKGYFVDTAWKNSSEVSYVFCTSSCAMFTTNLAADSTTKEEEPNGESGPVRISAFRWSHDTTKLAYIFIDNLPGGNMRLALGSKGKTTVIKVFATPGGGRGGSLDDNVSIYFSPDDKHVLVTNTATQPNSTDKSTIWVFESGGKEVLNLVADTGWPTQARWADSNRFLYKKGDSVYAYHLDDTTSQKIMSEKFLYNPVPYGQQLYYWVNTDGLPKIGGAQIVGYSHPEVLDNGHLVALKAKLAEGETLLIPFTNIGLSIIDLTTNKPTDLDVGDISLFSISPE